MTNFIPERSQIKYAPKQAMREYEQWGLPYKDITRLAEKLVSFCSRFSPCFSTQTNNKLEYALIYLQGLLWLQTKRNYTNIAHQVVGLEDDGQGLQHFMSDSPWSGKKIFAQIQAEIANRLELQDGMLSLDESGVACSGTQKAGASRQYLGREGKVDLGQVGVALTYYINGHWAMVDAELYLPESWFSESFTTLRTRLHIPEDYVYKSKITQGLEMIMQAKERGLPFKTISCDSFYGRDSQFRAELDDKGLIYMADIPGNTQVYLEKPKMAVPKSTEIKKGRPCSKPRVINQVQGFKVSDIKGHQLQTIKVRYTERGWLTYACCAREVYTITEGGEIRNEWLFVRKEKDGSTSFSLSNAPADTTLDKLSLWRSQRYFAERTFQDAKSEAGWDELVARKYRAWMHHTALDALALWFITEVKLEWSVTCNRDPELAEQFGVEVFPNLSMANIRLLLQAVLPLACFTLDQAMRLIIQQWINRARSTQCRVKRQTMHLESGFVT